MRLKKCRVCGELTNRRKYCSNACQKKAWKLRNREAYLIGKLKYRRKNKNKIKEYLKKWRKNNPEKVKKYKQDYKEKQKCK